MEKIKIDNTLCIKERFRFVFNSLNIDEFRIINAKKEKIALDEKIRKIKSGIRRKKRQEKICKMVESMKDEINNYLIRVSKPKNDFEKMLVEKMLKELGVVTSVNELSRFLKINKTCIYKAMDTGEILSFRRGRRRFVITEGVLPFLRD